MNARQAAKKWKREYMKLAMQPIRPVIQEQHDVRDIGYNIYLKGDYCGYEILTDDQEWEYELDKAIHELGKMALENSLWRASWDRKHEFATVAIRTKFVDINRPGIYDLEAIKADLENSERWRGL